MKSQTDQPSLLDLTLESQLIEQFDLIERVIIYDFFVFVPRRDERLDAFCERPAVVFAG